MAFGNKEHRKENNSRHGLLSLFIYSNAICEAVYAPKKWQYKNKSDHMKYSIGCWCHITCTSALDFKDKNSDITILYFRYKRVIKFLNRSSVLIIYHQLGHIFGKSNKLIQNSREQVHLGQKSTPNPRPPTQRAKYTKTSKLFNLNNLFCLNIYCLPFQISRLICAIKVAVIEIEAG